MSCNRNTRIICTIGPSVGTLELARSLIRRGMNMARFNFSHGDHASHSQAIARVRQAAEEENALVALILDTKGPEIRTGKVKDNGTVELVRGERIDLVAESDAVKIYGPQGFYTEKGRLTMSYDFLADDMLPGATILIADGLVSLEVIAVDGRFVHCLVLDGGEIGSRKNVNVIGVRTRLPSLTDQDKEDLLFGHQQGMDYVAASFIRKAADVTAIQKYLAEIGSDMPVIAKIEDEEGLENIEDIIRVSAGVMVARGDLGVQIPPEQVPLEQKRIINLCNSVGKPVITATQMLDSMIRNPRPTRAEAADVANAILDGTDCVMLSGETAGGLYPEAAVEVMERIARTVEASDIYSRRLDERRKKARNQEDMGEAIAETATKLADQIEASCLVVPTLSGNTARLISRHRPRRCIVAASPNEEVRRRLLLYWGIVPVSINHEADSETMIQGAISGAIREGYAQSLDKVVVVAGLPVNTPLLTNSIRIHVIGNVLGRGTQSFGGRCTGRIAKIHDEEDIQEEAFRLLHTKGGDILVLHTLDESYVPLLRLVKGVILEGVSEMSQEDILAANPDIVLISQVTDALSLFEENITVTLDGVEKLVYEGAL